MLEATNLAAEVKPADYVGKIITIRSNKHETLVVMGKCESITTAIREGAIVITGLKFEGLHSTFDINPSDTFGWYFSIESAITDWTKQD